MEALGPLGMKERGDLNVFSRFDVRVLRPFTVSLNMGRNQKDPTEQILNLTLEIILLLTGEEYFVVKKSGGKATNNGLQVVEGTLRWNVIHEQHNQKVLNITRKMMELLTGEVPIKYQDVAVYLSMEEWEYIEGHQDLYQDMMEDHRPRTSPGLPKDDTNEYPPMQEPYDRNSTNPNINTPPDHTQQNPPPTTTIKEELVSCNGRNLTQPTEENQITYIKEEPVSCNGGILTDPNIHVTTDVHTRQHSFTYLKEEPSLCDGGNIKDHKTAALDPTQHYLKGELVLQDGETITTPNIYVTEDHAQERSPPRFHEEPLPCSGGDLICNAQPYPAMEGMNPPETQSQVHDLKVQFSCSECKKCFLSMAELVSHQGVHVAEKLLQSRTQVFTTTIVQVSQVEPVKHKLLTCSTCGRTFYTKSSLVGHMKTHWGKVSETFRCNYCGKSFSTKSLLNLHSRLHFGHRPYVCSLCGERFMRNCDLGRHQKKHHCEEPNLVPSGSGISYEAQME